MRVFIYEVKFEKGIYVMSFYDKDTKKVYAKQVNDCMEDCLSNLYNFETNCWERYCISNQDVVIVNIDNVQIGL